MSTLETIGWILLIAILIATVVFWWWLVWIVCGYLMDYFALPGGVYMQIFLWFVVNAVLGMIGRVGMKAFE
jgi:hypothetical protein